MALLRSSSLLCISTCHLLLCFVDGAVVGVDHEDDDEENENTPL
jgi:hypothetical protein